MLYHAILAPIFAVIGGLVRIFVYSGIVSALNSRRLPGDAIPFAMTDLMLRNLEWSYGKM
jgi:hypothetical protein